MTENLKHLYKKKAELLGLPQARDIRHLEDVYHKRTKGIYVGDMVFGANDGIITTFAVVAGAAGAALSPGVIIILGVANLVADGLSMGIGNYLGKKSEKEYAHRQREKEEWETKKFPEIERYEVGEVFKEWGFEGKDRDRAVEIISSNKKVWVDFMMMNELGIPPEEKTTPIKSGFVMFGSFLLAGSIPLLPYFLPFVPDANLFLASVVFTGLALFVVGALRTAVTIVSWFRGGVEIFVMGSLAAGAAYVIGTFLRGFVDVMI